MKVGDIWVISDTHFGHENILRFKDKDGSYFRGEKFSSVKEMNECMIDNWNSVVKPGDRVYHLGDVFFGSKEDFKALWPKLNGSKRLIVGNHDDIKFLSSGGFFKKLSMWRMFPEFNCVLTHVPIHESSLRVWGDYGDEGLNIHGHIHQNPSPTNNHMCVSVEQINYTPVNLEEISSAKRDYQGISQ